MFQVWLEQPQEDTKSILVFRSLMQIIVSLHRNGEEAKLNQVMKATLNHSLLTKYGFRDILEHQTIAAMKTLMDCQFLGEG